MTEFRLDFPETPDGYIRVSLVVSVNGKMGTLSYILSEEDYDKSLQVGQFEEFTRNHTKNVIKNIRDAEYGIPENGFARIFFLHFFDDTNKLLFKIRNDEDPDPRIISIYSGEHLDD